MHLELPAIPELVTVAVSAGDVDLELPAISAHVTVGAGDVATMAKHAKTSEKAASAE